MPICVPVRDMKNTADFVGMVERESDVTVTKNGYSVIHCLSEAEYQLLQEERAKARLLSRMMLAEEEIANGNSLDFDEFSASIRREYGL